MTLIYLWNANVCLNSRDCLIIVQLDRRKFICKHHGRREVMFVNQEYFWTYSEMVSTGGDYLLFACLNDIQLLNVNISAITDVLLSTDIRRRLSNSVCSSKTIKDQFSESKLVHLHKCWTFHYKSPWVWDLNTSDVSKSPHAHLLLC